MEKYSENFIKEILAAEKIELIGRQNAVFAKFSDITNADRDSISFCKYRDERGQRLLEATHAAVVVCPREVTLPQREDILFVVVDNPRLCFARLAAAANPDKSEHKIHKTAVIGDNCQIGRVSIGAYAVIGDNVFLGDGSIIFPNVVIDDNVVIGRGSVIKSHTTIGQKGFGFEFDKDGIPFAIPHIGSVVIGDNVEIGAHNTIARGALKNTIVSDYVKTDDHVHIAHNVRVGKRTVITACAEISGSVAIGDDCHLGPNCSIMNGIALGDRALVGLGAVVIRAVPDDAVVAGNPARIIKKNEQ